MKTLLIDIDSTIPNLALMHIASWKKGLGYEVGFNVEDPDEVYASCVFKDNRHLADGFDDALLRCNILREYKTLPYIMVNRDAKRTQRMTDLKRWAKPQIFFKFAYNEYNRSARA